MTLVSLYPPALRAAFPSGVHPQGCDPHDRAHAGQFPNIVSRNRAVPTAPHAGARTNLRRGGERSHYARNRAAEYLLGNAMLQTPPQTCPAGLPVFRTVANQSCVDYRAKIGTNLSEHPAIRQALAPYFRDDVPDMPQRLCSTLVEYC